MCLSCRSARVPGNQPSKSLVPSSAPTQNQAPSFESIFKSLGQNVQPASVPENKPVANFGSYNMPGLSNSSNPSNQTGQADLGQMLITFMINLITTLLGKNAKPEPLSEEKSSTSVEIDRKSESLPKEKFASLVDINKKSEPLPKEKSSPPKAKETDKKSSSSNLVGFLSGNKDLFGDMTSEEILWRSMPGTW